MIFFQTVQPYEQIHLQTLTLKNIQVRPSDISDGKYYKSLCQS